MKHYYILILICGLNLLINAQKTENYFDYSLEYEINLDSLQNSFYNRPLKIHYFCNEKRNGNDFLEFDSSQLSNYMQVISADSMLWVFPIINKNELRIKNVSSSEHLSTLKNPLFSKKEILKSNIEKLGQEVINGQSCTKYQTKATAENRKFICIDEKNKLNNANVFVAALNFPTHLKGLVVQFMVENHEIYTLMNQKPIQLSLSYDYDKDLGFAQDINNRRKAIYARENKIVEDGFEEGVDIYDDSVAVGTEYVEEMPIEPEFCTYKYGFQLEDGDTKKYRLSINVLESICAKASFFLNEKNEIDQVSFKNFTLRELEKFQQQLKEISNYSEVEIDSWVQRLKDYIQQQEAAANESLEDYDF